MDKEFERYCARVKREREGMLPRAKVADWIREEGVQWLVQYSASEVARRTGFSESFVRRWKKPIDSFSKGKMAPRDDEEMPAVLNVTRIAPAAEGTNEKVLARLVCGNTVLELCEREILLQVLSRVLP